MINVSTEDVVIGISFPRYSKGRQKPCSLPRITEQRSCHYRQLSFARIKACRPGASSEKRYDILCGFPDGAFKRDYGLGGSLRDEKKRNGSPYAAAFGENLGRIRRVRTDRGQTYLRKNQVGNRGSRRSMTNNTDVIIIGAGAAGLMAAVSASSSGKKCIVLEKNNIPGKKLLITGKGRCNLTNDADIDEIIRNFPGNGKFLYSTLYTFSNRDLLNFLVNTALKTKTERGGRIFPESDKAQDVVRALMKAVERYKVTMIYNTAVKELIIENGKVIGVKTANDQVYYANSVIIATGGKSYPRTGSTGDGYVWLSRPVHRDPSGACLGTLIHRRNLRKRLDGSVFKECRGHLLRP